MATLLPCQGLALVASRLGGPPQYAHSYDPDGPRNIEVIFRHFGYPVPSDARPPPPPRLLPHSRFFVSTLLCTLVPFLLAAGAVGYRVFGPKRWTHTETYHTWTGGYEEGETTVLTATQVRGAAPFYFGGGGVRYGSGPATWPGTERDGGLNTIHVSDRPY